MIYLDPDVLDPSSIELAFLLTILCLVALLWWTRSDRRFWQ